MIVKKVGSVAPKKIKEKEEEIDLSLPSEKSKPCDKLSDYSILLYGAKKIGKTTLASMFPKALFLMCEPGGKALSIYSRRVKNWREFKGYVKLICKDKFFENVVIDTADFMYEYAMDYTCKKLLITHPSEEAWGKGWKAVKAEVTTEVNKLLHSGKGIIFISHSKEEEIKKRDGDTYNRTSSTLPGQAKELLEGVVDIWSYYAYEGSKRVLYVQGDDYVDAGHRVEGRFRYSDGTRVKKVHMGSSKEVAYENLTSAFNNKLENKSESKEQAVKTAVKIKK